MLLQPKAPVPSSTDKDASLDITERLLRDLSSYSTNAAFLSQFSSDVSAEIQAASSAMRRLFGRQKRFGITRFFSQPAEAFGERSDRVARDQALWRLPTIDDDTVDSAIKFFEAAHEQESRISALLCLKKLAHRNLARSQDFFQSLAADKCSIDLSEWALLAQREIDFLLGKDADSLGEPVSMRPWKHVSGHAFDLTMPLHFQCTAVTKIASASVRTIISPAWFREIFGDAMALIRAQTFESRLILEKEVTGLHPDGSAHYEHFPFGGQTYSLRPSIYIHNYWSSVKRPFYTSGTTEIASPAKPVIRKVPMTFFRLAMTVAPDKYTIETGRLPESVRGVFFGFGHIEPKTLLARGGKIRAGDFQISSHLNPSSKSPANTVYFGTFFGKLSDTGSDGTLVANGRRVHCDVDGQLDYHGDGSFQADPVCPADW